MKTGEKAIWLCMPLAIVKPKDPDDPNAEIVSYRHFIWKPRWFVLSQTEGKPYEPESIPSWSKEEALGKLEIKEVPFVELDGNIQGYAKGRTIAVSPLAEVPTKTLFHELGHVLLGHTKEGETREGVDLPINLREAEAECVALICSDALELPGGDYCRGYINHWYGLGNPIPEASAMKIFGEADAILRAGRI